MSPGQRMNRKAARLSSPRKRVPMLRRDALLNGSPLSRGRQRVMQIMRGLTMLPEGAPRLDEILIQSEAVPWREKSLKGVHEKMLWRNEATGASIALIKFDKGAGIPQPH